MLASGCSRGFLSLIFATILMPAAYAASSENVTAIKTVGIISATGKFRLHYVGTTVFSNGESTGDIADWNLDAETASDIRETLGGQYDVRPVQYEAADFDADRTDGLFSDSASRISDAVRDHAKPSEGMDSYDIYLVVSPAVQSDTIASTTRPLKGLGVYKRGFLGANTIAIYTSCYLSVVDGHSFKLLGQELLRSRTITGGEALGHLLFHGMLRAESLHPYFEIVDDTFWADEFSQLTQTQKTLIQVALKKLLKEEVPVTLRDLKLVP